VLALANQTLTPDQALASPRYASAVLFAQKVAPVLRGVLKPLAGIFLPRVALEVVNAFASATTRPADPLASAAPPSGPGGGQP
jgi:hypothetical protein